MIHHPCLRYFCSPKKTFETRKEEQNIHRQEKCDPFAVQNRGVVSVDFSLKKNERPNMLGSVEIFSKQNERQNVASVDFSSNKMKDKTL
jgi:hypothetical protein